MNLQTLTDEQLATLRREIAIEIERRQRLEQLPQTIADLAAQYIADGGDTSALQDAISI